MLTNFDYDTRYWTPEVLRASGKIAFWMDPSDGKSLTLNGSTVAQINDKSSSNWNAVQTTAANQPTLDASTFSKYSLSCDGSNDVMAPPAFRLQRSASDSAWSSVCWSPELGLFCAVGNSVVMTSPDGINWTSRTAAAGYAWNSVCWSPSLGKFCAVSPNGGTDRAMLSSDGINWSLCSSIPASPWVSVCWSPSLGLFCAVAYAGTYQVATSPDGLTWTGQSVPAAYSWNCVCWSPELGKFCAVSPSGGTDRVMTSTNGTSWTLQSGIPALTWYTVAWSSGLSLFAAAGENCVMTSPDGITWTERTGVAGGWTCLSWGQEYGVFAATSYRGTSTLVMTTSNGIDWEAVPTPTGRTDWNSICYSSQLKTFVCVSSAGTDTRVMTGEFSWNKKVDGGAFHVAYVCNSSSVAGFGISANDYDGTTGTIPLNVTSKSFVYGATTLNSTGVPTTGKMLIEATHDGVSTMQAWTNGVSWGTGTRTATSPTNGQLAFPYNAQAGQFGEIIILSTVLTTTERWKLEGYLAHKWGMRDLLPDGHPYKTKPPVR